MGDSTAKEPKTLSRTIIESVITFALLALSVGFGLRFGLGGMSEGLHDMRAEQEAAKISPKDIQISEIRLAPPIDKYPFRVFAEVKNDGDKSLRFLQCAFTMTSKSGELVELIEATAQGFGDLKPNESATAVFMHRSSTRETIGFDHVYGQDVDISCKVLRANTQR